MNAKLDHLQYKVAEVTEQIEELRHEMDEDDDEHNLDLLLLLKERQRLEQSIENIRMQYMEYRDQLHNKGMRRNFE